MLKFFKPNLFHSSGLQSCSFRLSSSLLPPCASPKVILKIVPSSSQLQFNSPIRSFCKYTNSHDDRVFEDIVYDNLTVDKYKELIKEKDDEYLIEEILSDYEYLKFETGAVPSSIKIKHMYELMKMPRDQWPQSFKFLSDKEKFLKSKKLRDTNFPKSMTYTEIQKIRDDGKQPELGLHFDPETGAPLYGEWLNSHFIRLRKYEYRCSFVPNLLASYMFGQRLIIDCDYDYPVIEAKRVAHDIQKAFALNRFSPEPFNFTLTGLGKSPLLRELLDSYSVSFNSTEGNIGIDIHTESFTELFSGQKLIYLSPHSKNSLTKYDDDATYILGGLSSKVIDALSYKKAISLKIPNYCFNTEGLPFRAMRMAKCFDLTECTGIMLNFKQSRNFRDAVSSGIRPGRFKSKEEIAEEQRYRLKKLFLAQKRAKNMKPIIR